MKKRRRPPTAPIGYSVLRSLPPDQLAEKLAGPPELVARWLQAAANYGVVEAQTVLGQILLDGRGVAKDRRAGARWFKIAAEAGHPAAINMLGRCYELGVGVSPDLSRAVVCYRQAAEAGLDWGEYNYANLLLRGRGVSSDRQAALTLYRRAASQGHAKSINMVGRFIEEGWETKADAGIAAGWYRRAAEAGDFRGQYNLASILALGGDVIQAETWLHRAMQSATADFLALMSSRLAKNVEPRLREVGAIAATLAAAKSAA